MVIGRTGGFARAVSPSNRCITTTTDLPLPVLAWPNCRILLCLRPPGPCDGAWVDFLHFWLLVGCRLAALVDWFSPNKVRFTQSEERVPILRAAVYLL